MGRVSVREHKNIYQKKREELKWSREKASEMLQGISASRLEKIESGKVIPDAEEILIMMKGYKAPEFRNHYCSCECRMGQNYIPELKSKQLSQIVLEMLAYLNSVQSKKDRLIEITVDGNIDSDELADFIEIRNQLEKIASTVESLKLWSEAVIEENSK